MDIPGNKRFASRVVDLATIDDGPGPFSMSFDYDVTLLAQSIETVGLVNPPIVAESDNGVPMIVAGQRRITALKSLGWEQATCHDISSSRLRPFELLRLNLYDNLPTRSFNLVEKAMILARLAAHISEEEILGRYMVLLDLPAYGQTLLTFMNIEQKLEKEIKESLAQGRLSLHVVKLLLEMEPEDRSSTFRLIKDLNFNINQQKQLLDFIIDISRIEETPVTKLLVVPSIEKICSDANMNSPQKTRAILHFLRSKRLPSVVRAEQAFKKRVSRLNLPKGVRINASPFFEGPYYGLEVRFREGKELAEKIAHLSKVQGLDELRDPWEPVD